MTNHNSIRHELTQEMARQGYTLSSFSKVSGINRGVLSLTLNEKATKSLSMNQLNQMTEALQFPAGWLYELYAQEMLADIENVSWRRMKDLLVHCLHLKKMILIETVLNALKYKPIHVKYIFSFAEQLVDQDPTNIAPLSIFYQYVLDHEMNLQTERFAISQYRLFQANLGLDLQKSVRAAVLFTPYRHALPIHLKLDALIQLIYVSFVLKDWNLLKQYGEELLIPTQLMYSMIKNNQYSNKKIYKRPLVHYYGKSYLVQCAALEVMGEYEEAQKLIAYFADLSWFEDLNSEGRLEVEKFAIWAKCNHYNIELLQGNYSLLRPYIDYLEFFPEEQPASLEIILKASNIYKWDIDDILDKYHNTIYPSDILIYLSNTTNYSMIVETNRYINIYYELALYYFERKKNSEQLEKILFALKYNVEKYNQINTFDSTELFEKLYQFYFKAN